ncbi:MAG TPA: hypothetical protein VMQ62_08560 [Dongiaceae bacterium]|nr:hypothetical protein [Dongiaceae bacterium]
MGRSIGVRLVALGLLGLSVWTLVEAWRHAHGRRGESVITASIVLAVLGLAAAEALWSLRGHAFLLYAVWAIGAILAVTMLRLNSPAGAHAVRLVPTVVYTGLVLGGVAIYLRRAV